MELPVILREAAALARQHGVEVRVSASGAVVIKPLAVGENGQPVDKRAERNRRYYEARRLKEQQAGQRLNRLPPSDSLNDLKTSESVLNRLNAEEEAPAPLPLSPSLPPPPQTPPSPAHPHTPTPGHTRVREAEAAEGESTSAEATPKPQAWAPDAEQKRVNRWFSRRDTTAWSKPEQKAWKAIPAAAKADGLQSLEAAYTATQGEACRFRRRDLLTLLNHWQGEIDRWRHFKAPAQSDVRPLQAGYEDPPFLTDDAAIFHPTHP